MVDQDRCRTCALSSWPPYVIVGRFSIVHNAYVNLVQNDFSIEAENRTESVYFICVENYENICFDHKFMF